MTRRPPTPLEAARLAKAAAIAEFSRSGLLQGVGIVCRGDGYAIKVALSAPLESTAAIPPDINGVPLEVEVVGRVVKREP